MSLLSEIAIEPGKSETYLRLISVLYLSTIFLIIYSSTYFIIKLILIALIITCLRNDWSNKKPWGRLKKIEFIDNKWILEMEDAKKQDYTQATILINNILFQLIQFENPQQKKLIVLFHDQATNSQLRLLHLKITQNGI
ncbi:MAG: hypothetical protein HYX60_07975 [Legionella longbeachae]|nr:hypothetical protein [Legionella longbeachae]